MKGKGGLVNGSFTINDLHNEMLNDPNGYDCIDNLLDLDQDSNDEWEGWYEYDIGCDADIIASLDEQERWSYDDDYISYDYYDLYEP